MYRNRLVRYKGRDRLYESNNNSLDSKNKPRLVLIDDDYITRYIFKKLHSKSQLNNEIELYTSQDGVEGLGYVYILHPEIIIIDTTLPKYGGREMLDYILTNNVVNEAITKVIVISHLKEEKSKLPPNYLFIDKTDPEFLSKLFTVIKESCKEPIAHLNGVHSILVQLAKPVLRLASTSSNINYKTELATHVLRKLYLQLASLFVQFVNSFLVGVFIIFTKGKDKDQNILQRDKDLIQSRVKAYPAWSFFIATTFITIFQLTLSIFALSGFTRAVSEQVLAVSYTWDGGGSTNDWSECANWSSDTCPTSADTAVFDATSTKDANVDSSFGTTIASVAINAGYTGTITQQRSLIISTSFTLTGTP